MNTTVSMMISVLIFFFILRGQLSGMKKPLKKSGITLLLPIAFVSTSLMQLFDPSLHISGEQAILALAIGMIVSIPLIATTGFEVRGGNTFIKRNKTVFALLLLLFALRFVAIALITSIDPSTLGFLCNLFTLGYIVTWRVASFVKFRGIRAFGGLRNHA
ncbi:CcdC protein domain-containing protein [Paenibacillus aurantiacus]|uniref:CcdC protein domain-containing protein n=1 Tax=Paenibacillus aurantiacus TaxID=1936118 RepID=A0ABV5KIX0_9BACL